MQIIKKKELIIIIIIINDIQIKKKAKKCMNRSQKRKLTKKC